MVKHHPKVVVIVQARIGSTRLPGKVMKKVLGKPLLGYLLERLRRVLFANEIVVATTQNAKDQVIVDFCRQENVPTYRGSEEDVLSRYREAGVQSQADVIVRITSDCPLIDPVVVDQAIRCFLEHKPRRDYVSNALVRSYPRGMEVEVFSRQALEEAFEKAKKPEEREHVTPYIYRHPDQFQIENFAYSTDISGLRLTVDTQEDFDLIRKVLEALYPEKPAFSLEDILSLLQNHSEWLQINQHIKQKGL